MFKFKIDKSLCESLEFFVLILSIHFSFAEKIIHVWLYGPGHKILGYLLFAAFAAANNIGFTSVG